MEKYINIKQLYQCETCSHHFSGKCDTWCECGESYRPAMVLLNIIEAEEVRHGEWIYDHWCEFKCSECGEWSNSKPYKGRELYCPNCGAKMDGGKNDL